MSGHSHLCLYIFFQYGFFSGFHTRGMTTMSQQLDPVELPQAETELPSMPKQLDPEAFKDAVVRSGINFFCGVPDSLLKRKF